MGLEQLGPWASCGPRGSSGASAADGLTCRVGRCLTAGREGLGSRCRWLAAPRSTVVQPGTVHTGLTEDPDAEADRLLRLLVPPIEGRGRPAPPGSGR